jgi:hypothetical protein
MAQFDELDANHMLLDREILDPDDVPIGKVDDIELSEPYGDEGPELTALLCGPLALGPRLGGRIGAWWYSIGRRLRIGSDPTPVRIPIEDVITLDRSQLRVGKPFESYGTYSLREWVDDHLISRIPGGGHARR